MTMPTPTATPREYATMITITGPRADLNRFARLADVSAPVYANDPAAPPTGQQSAVKPQTAQPAKRLPSGSPATTLNFHFHGIVPVPAMLSLNRYDMPGLTINGRRWEIDHWGCPREGFEAAGSLDAKGLSYVIKTHDGGPIPFVHAASAIFPSLQFEYVCIEVAIKATVTGKFRGVRRFERGAS